MLFFQFFWSRWYTRFIGVYKPKRGVVGVIDDGLNIFWAARLNVPFDFVFASASGVLLSVHTIIWTWSCKRAALASLPQFLRLIRMCASSSAAIGSRYLQVVSMMSMHHFSWLFRLPSPLFGYVSFCRMEAAKNRLQRLFSGNTCVYFVCTNVWNVIVMDIWFSNQLILDFWSIFLKSGLINWFEYCFASLKVRQERKSECRNIKLMSHSWKFLFLQTVSADPGQACLAENIIVLLNFIHIRRRGNNGSFRSFGFHMAKDIFNNGWSASSSAD